MVDDDAMEVMAEPGLFGDVVLARKDAPASYHLAVTVDDAAQGVTDVVRGRDLFDSTHVHRLLQALLDLPTPTYHHHALLIDAEGQRLAKRHGAPTLADLRASGADPAALAGTAQGRAIAFWIFARRGVESDAMQPVLVILLVLAAGATAFVLVKGVIGMAQQQGPYRPPVAGTDAQAHPVSGDRDPDRRPAAADVRQTEAALVRLNKIYTRTGDAGETGLVDGSRAVQGRRRGWRRSATSTRRTARSASRCSHVGDEAVRAMLQRIQNELFDLGADLATPGEDFAPSEMVLRIVPEQIARLEREIDAMNEELEPLQQLHPARPAKRAAAHLHLARAIVRRAERSAVAAGQAVSLNPLALAYLNRLSDHLFVAARLAAKQEGGDDIVAAGSDARPLTFA